MNKICTKCNLDKNQDDFSFIKRYNSYNSICRNCMSIYQKQYRKNNKNILTKLCKEYYLKNKEVIRVKQAKYRKDNIKMYRKKNKDYYYANRKSIILKKLKYKKQRRKIDFSFKLRGSVSRAIALMLSSQNKSKFRKSCLNYLSYSIEELKIHLENQFESWMNWNNYGMYISNNWNDNDQSTWKWNIDHIIPQSSLPYTSMEDDNFKKCWALSNLRPYSAKQNNSDGINRIRHK